jgi:hypothetical protein
MKSTITVMVLLLSATCSSSGFDHDAGWWCDGNLRLTGENEHEARVRYPDVGVAAVAAVQPLLAYVMDDAEDAEVVIRIRDRLHGDAEPFPQRLILVLQPELRTHLVWAEIETQLERPIEDAATNGALRKTKISDRNDHEIDFCFCPARRESWPAEEVVAPVTDLHSRLIDRLSEIIGRLETGTNLDGFPKAHHRIPLLRDHEGSALRLDALEMVAAQIPE